MVNDKYVLTKESQEACPRNLIKLCGDDYSVDELVNLILKNQEIYKMIEERIADLQKGFAAFEQIKKFTLLPHAFTMERGELTNTLKLRRSIINKIYKKEIELMYV